MLLRATLLLLLSCLLALPAMADLQTNELSDPELQQRYQKLTRELRCPMCQNENIAESSAPISNDMRREVHRRLEAGQSDEEIVGALVERFGEFVRYRPEMSARTYVLWYGPFVGVGIGILVVLLLGLRARRNRQEDAASPLNDAERERVRELLKEKGQD